jgi:type I restriction enzyme R subunit
VGGSPELRSKKELIDAFLKTVNTSTQVQEDWRAFIEEKRRESIDELVASEHLKPEATAAFIENTFREGALKTTGTDIDALLPPLRRFGKGGNRAEKKKQVVEKLRAFFDQFLGLFSSKEV